MRIVGGSIRHPAHLTIAISAAILVALTGAFDCARAAAAAPADTAAAAALYERTNPDSGAPATSKSSSTTAAPAPADSNSASASTTTDADEPPTVPNSSASAIAPSPPTPPPNGEAPLPPVTTETVIVPASMPAPTYVKHAAAVPPSTTEIPQKSVNAAPAVAPVAPADAGPEPGTAEIDTTPPDAQTTNYLAHQNPQVLDPQLHSLQEFINEADGSSPLGVQLREDQRKLNSGEIANGLLIVDVQQHSAAAIAGLHALKRTTRNVLTGVAVAASMFFPPAVLMVPIVDQMNLGDNYDMIIGVDGSRVATYLDFEDHMRDIQPGEIVYLSLVRNGNRVQVPVHIKDLSPPVF